MQCNLNYSHFFCKNIRILYIESAKTVNEMTLNELVKLTTLWTTGSWIFTVPICPEIFPLRAHIIKQVYRVYPMYALRQASTNSVDVTKYYCCDQKLGAELQIVRTMFRRRVLRRLNMVRTICRGVWTWSALLAAASEHGPHYLPRRLIMVHTICHLATNIWSHQ